MKLTWREFNSKRMSKYMKKYGGHAPAIRKIAEEWKEYNKKPNAPKSIFGIQSYKSSNLKKYTEKYGNIKISKDKKPSWFDGTWKQTYTIIKKN